MKRRFAMIAAFSAVLGLSACGGGGDDDVDVSSATNANDAPALVKTDTVVGSGADIPENSIVAANYSLWLYDGAAAGSKGTLIEGPAMVNLPLSSLVKGWQQGVPGMKVGGKRTLIVPSSLGYGATATGKIPANSGLVFDIEVTGFSRVYDAPALVKTDTLVGSGIAVAANQSGVARYTMWLYDSTKPDFKGIRISGPVTIAYNLTAKAMIGAWEQGVVGMRLGGKRTLIVPSSLGYGATGDGPIPANSGLVLDVEMLTVN